MNTRLSSVVLLAVSLGAASHAYATPFTSTSPTTGLDVTTVGASTVGGIVVNLTGLNGANVVSQLSASSLFVGFAGNNPLTIGTQAGFDSAVTGAMGGGFQSASVRFTLFDGDTATGEFDFNDNTLLVNGLNFGNWSSVDAQNTDGSGNAGLSGSSGGGFRNGVLDTGWFTSTNTTLLGSLFSSLVGTEELVFGLDDVDPFDNFFDFTQGIDNSLINVGQGPTVTPPTVAVPEPTSLALLGLGLAGLFARRRKL